jgi:hypothetical protein
MGPRQAPRPPEDLGPGPAHLARAVAAVHQACETLTVIAAAGCEQVRAARRAGRLLEPTRSLPFRFGIAYTLVPAHRVGVLLAAYHDAEAASAQARVAVADAAQAVRAPSHILTVARAAIEASGRQGRCGRRESAAGAAEPEMPGPVERVLTELGVTNTGLLQRAAAIDHAADQLILDAALATGTQRPLPAAAGLGAIAGTAELVSHVLGSGDPRGAARHPPSRRYALSRRPDPDRGAAHA